MDRSLPLRRDFLAMVAAQEEAQVPLVWRQLISCSYATTCEDMARSNRM